MLKEHKKQIVKTIQSMSGAQSPYNIFSDWIAIMALSIANASNIFHDSVWKEREKQYLQIVGKYDKKHIDGFVEMFGLLIQAYEDDMTDLLGEIYMESGCGNRNTGQVFTPYSLSIATAEMTIPKDYDGSHKITINEPTCGGGGMIIAAADVLKRRGINYQRCMKVFAQDLDWKCVYMCYVQLSLLGVDAVVVQGDTLCDPYTGGNYPRSRVFRTPNNMGLLLFSSGTTENAADSQQTDEELVLPVFGAEAVLEPAGQASGLSASLDELLDF